MSSQKTTLALDVGARSAKLVWVEARNGEPVITRAETFALPMDEEDPHKLIATWIDSLGVSKHFCAVALPGSQTVFQSGRIMPNDPRSPEEVAAMDIAQFSEMAGDEMTHDVFAFEPPYEPNVRRYIMSMARPQVIQETIRDTRLNHLRPADLIPAPVALHNAVEHWAPEHELPWCYVSIGHNQTELAVGYKLSLLFARSIAIGGKSFTDAVVNATGLHPAQAEVRKHGDCGLRETDACFEELRGVADRWISQYNACMGVYRSQFQDRKMQVEKLVISGGATLLKGFKEYVAQKLGIQVITTDELRAQSGKPEAAEKRPDAQFDIAFGLAVTAMQLGTTYLSLLPAELKDEVVFRQKKPWWIAAAVFIFAGMAIYSATGLLLIKRDKAHLEAEQQKLRKLEQIDKQIQNTRSYCSQIVTNSVPLSDLLMNAPLARDVLTLVSSTVDPNDWITLFCDEKIYNLEEQELEEAIAASAGKASGKGMSLFRSLRTNPKRKAPTLAPATASKKEAAKKKEIMEPLRSVFIVEGYTQNPSLKTVKEMIERLKSAPEIARVDLRSDDKVLKPTGIPDSEADKMSNFSRFVIEIEVKRQ
ncbi:MAG: pilus assembly protein PilM [Kiritimatiellae bacterium]|nr:pilus assembly protein PilM [Kiritimatiellia bacterium]